MNLVEQVCDYKIANNVAIFQTERWNDIFKSRTEWAEKLQINPAFVEEIYKLIYIESIRKHHEKIA
jgi:chorismate mutase